MAKNLDFYVNCCNWCGTKEGLFRIWAIRFTFQDWVLVFDMQKLILPMFNTRLFFFFKVNKIFNHTNIKAVSDNRCRCMQSLSILRFKCQRVFLFLVVLFRIMTPMTAIQKHTWTLYKCNICVFWQYLSKWFGHILWYRWQICNNFIKVHNNLATFISKDPTRSLVKKKKKTSVWR